jgi:acyl carrier protein
MTDSATEKVKDVLFRILDIQCTPEQLDESTSLYSTTVGLDSLTLLRVITELERVFDCEIDDEAVMTADLVDVKSLVDLVLGQLEGGAGRERESVASARSEH